MTTANAMTTAEYKAAFGVVECGVRVPPRGVNHRGRGNRNEVRMRPDDSTPTRTCSCCGRSLPRDEAHFPRRCPGGPLRGVCRDCRRVEAAAFREANRDRIRSGHKAWRDAHAGNVKRYRDAARRDDPERVRRYGRDWLSRNPDRRRVGRLNDLAHRVYGVLGTLTKEDVAQAYESQEGLCAYCMTPLGDRYTVDHMVPMSRGGANVAENIVVACKSCNCRKNDSLLEEWIPS